MSRRRVGVPDGPIVAWRWFRVGPAGKLEGANRVVWPAGRPLTAEHVVAFATPPAEPPTLQPVWQAATRPARAAATVALLAGGAAVTVRFPWVGALLFVMAAGIVDSIRGRRTFPVGAARAAGTVLFAVCVVLVEVAGAIVAAWGGGANGANVAVLVFTAVLAVFFALHHARALSGRRPHHVCPAPPARFGAHWRPECGIHAYRSTALALADRSHLYGARPAVLARVALWGRCYAYSDGWRAQHGQVTGIRDDGSGHVELPAAIYRCELLAAGNGAPTPPPRPAGPTRATPRWWAAVPAAHRRVRTWAADRQRGIRP